MSRGPGRWQRAILAALDEYDVVPIADLCDAVLGRPGERSELVAARRAAHRLADTDQLREIWPWYCWRCGTVLRQMDYAELASGCPRGHGHPGTALAVTRDPVVMSEELRGTTEATKIPQKLSVAFINETTSGNT
jgi:hypothetical protein